MKNVEAFFYPKLFSRAHKIQRNHRKNNILLFISEKCHDNNNRLSLYNNPSCYHYNIKYQFSIKVEFPNV